MASPGGKFFSFLSGILIGMLAGLGLSFLMMNQFNPLALFNSDWQIGKRDTVVDMRSARPLTVKSNKSPKSVNAESELPELPIAPLDFADSSEESTSSKMAEASNEEIVVKRDELILTKDVQVNQFTTDSKDRKRDSLIQTLQGGNPTPVPFKVEFWESPINYRGYRLLKNKVVVFGLNPTLNTSVSLLKGKYYLRHGQAVYQLQEHADFEAFLIETNEGILKEIIK